MQSLALCWTWNQGKRTEEALGDKFDIRDNHEMILSDFAKPLVALETKVDCYIAVADAK